MSMDRVHVDYSRLDALNLFSKREGYLGGKFRVILLSQPQMATLKKNSLIYSCKRILLGEGTDTGNWQKYSEISIYRRLGRSKGENILLEICLLKFFPSTTHWK